MALRPGGVRLRLSAGHDGSHQGRGDRGAHRRRDHRPGQPVRRHDEVPGRLVPGGARGRVSTRCSRWPGPISTRSRWCCRCRTPTGATTSSRCSTCGATSSRRSASATTGTGAANFLIAGPGWQGTPPADVKQTFRSPTRFVWVNGQMQANGPQDYDGGERAAEAVQADAAQRLGPALHAAGRGAGRRRRRHEDAAARAGAEDGRRRLLRAARAADEGQPAGPRRRPDGREAEDARHRAGQGLRHRARSIRTPPRACSARWARSGCCRRA